MGIFRSFLVGIPSTIVCFGLLLIIYPWSTYYDNFEYGPGVTFGSYLLLSFLVGLIGSIVGGGLSVITAPALSKAALCAALSFGLLLAGSLLLGPGGINIFDTRIRGIFFSELKFVTFIGTVALPISIFNAGLSWLTASR